MAMAVCIRWADDYHEKRSSPPLAAPPAAPARLLLLLGVALLWSLQMACVCGKNSPRRQIALPDDIRIENFSGRHIAFMGDSITRYQYISLVSFLEHGAFPANGRTWETPAGAELPNPTWEKNFFPDRESESATVSEEEKWGRFFNGSNAQLQGHEVCDCFRPDHLQNLNENRYYHNPTLNISISFLFWRGSRYPLQGSLVPESEGREHPGVSPERTYEAMGCRLPQCTPPFAWRSLPEETILKHFMALRPTDFVANAGFWSIDRVNWEAVASAGEQLCKKHGCNLFWKTTTPGERLFSRGCSDVDERKHLMHKEMVQHGWQLYDSFRMICNMAGPVHVDLAHFNGETYARLNHELLRHIASSDRAKPVLHSIGEKKRKKTIGKPKPSKVEPFRIRLVNRRRHSAQQ